MASDERPRSCQWYIPFFTRQTSTDPRNGARIENCRVGLTVNYVFDRISVTTLECVSLATIDLDFFIISADRQDQSFLSLRNVTLSNPTLIIG